MKCLQESAHSGLESADSSTDSNADLAKLTVLVRVFTLYLRGLPLITYAPRGIGGGVILCMVKSLFLFSFPNSLTDITYLIFWNSENEMVTNPRQTHL